MDLTILENRKKTENTINENCKNALIECGIKSHENFEVNVNKQAVHIMLINEEGKIINDSEIKIYKIGSLLYDKPTLKMDISPCICFDTDSRSILWKITYTSDLLYHWEKVKEILLKYMDESEQLFLDILKQNNIR